MEATQKRSKEIRASRRNSDAYYTKSANFSAMIKAKDLVSKLCLGR